MTIRLYYKPPCFLARGEVRGDYRLRTTPQAALKDVLRDHEACARLGGGAYSDQDVWCSIEQHLYMVKTELDAQGYPQLVLDCEFPPDAQVLEQIGEEIAQGRSVRRSRLKADDWNGWLVDEGNGLWRVFVRWPDGAEAHEVHVEHQAVCAVER